MNPELKVGKLYKTSKSNGDLHFFVTAIIDGVAFYYYLNSPNELRTCSIQHAIHYKHSAYREINAKKD